MRIVWLTRRWTKPLPARSDDTGKPACLRPLDTVRRKQIDVAGSAESTRVDILLVEAREDELIPVRGPRIELELRSVVLAPTRRRREEPAIDEMPRVTGSGEGVHQFRANLVAARTDARADCGDEIRGTSAEFACQGIHRRGGHTSRRSPPACVHRSDGARSRVADKDRHAIRRAHGDGDVGVARDNYVSFRTTRGNTPGHEDAAAVHLSKSLNAGCAYRFANPAPILRRRQRQLTRRKEVWRNRLQRYAPQRRAPGLLDPLEGIWNSRKTHVR